MKFKFLLTITLLNMVFFSKAYAEKAQFSENPNYFRNFDITFDQETEIEVYFTDRCGQTVLTGQFVELPSHQNVVDNSLSLLAKFDKFTNYNDGDCKETNEVRLAKYTLKPTSQISATHVTVIVPSFLNLRIKP